MVSAILLTTGTSLATVSVVPYIKNILRGKTKPRLVSWAVWSILLGLTAAVSWQEGQTSSAVLSTASALACAAVVILAYGRTALGLTRLEAYTLLGSLLGIGMWLIFDNPMLVLVTALCVDAIAYIPTFVNGWKNPGHESLSSFLISAAGASLVLITAVIEQDSSQGLVYPIYSVLFASIMIGILLIRGRASSLD